jgi:phage shock protein A
MSKLVESLQSLELNLRALISRNQSLKTQQKDLKRQLSSKDETISELNLEIDRLQKENKTLKTANAMLGSSEHKRETKLKINSLIKEIDSCIVQLAE